MEAHLVPDAYLEAAAVRFRLLGDPVRLRLLDLLNSQGELSVQDLATAAGQSHANTSKHLRLLAEHGIVARRQEGAFARYRVSDPSIQGLCLLMCARLQSEAV